MLHAQGLVWPWVQRDVLDRAEDAVADTFVDRGAVDDRLDAKPAEQIVDLRLRPPLRRRALEALRNGRRAVPGRGPRAALRPRNRLLIVIIRMDDPEVRLNLLRAVAVRLLFAVRHLSPTFANQTRNGVAGELRIALLLGEMALHVEEVVRVRWALNAAAQVTGMERRRGGVGEGIVETPLKAHWV